MGLTKQYLKYDLENEKSVQGVVGTGSCVQFLMKNGESGQSIIVSAGECLIIWNMRTGEKEDTICAEVGGTVTALECFCSNDRKKQVHMAIGYSNGVVLLYDAGSKSFTKFKGHRTSVTTLVFDDLGMKLASAGSDGDVVVWDVPAEEGMVRLKAHTGKITKLKFMKERNILVTSGVDTYVKFWNLDSSHCFHTLTGHGAEVVDFKLVNNDTKLITGCSAGILRIYSISFPAQVLTSLRDAKEEVVDQPSKVRVSEKEVTTTDTVDAEESSEIIVSCLGSLTKSTSHRVQQIAQFGPYIACLSKNKIIDCYMILSEEEALECKEKRLKKYRKRKRKGQDPADEPDAVILADEIKKLSTFSCEFLSNRIAMCMDKSTIKLVSLNKNNTVSLYQYKKDVNWEHISTIQQHGHRREIKDAALGPFDTVLVTASGDSIKTWNRESGKNKNTIGCDSVLSLILAPRNGHAVVGTKSGRIQLYDLASCECIQDEEGHMLNEHQEACVWSLASTSDKNGFVSGGADCMLQFWSYEMIDSGDSNKKLGFIRSAKNLKVSDQIMALQCSPDGQYVCMATLDMKEIICFFDSLKVKHELYGKSMPSTCLDFSDDSQLIVTGSKDANLRIYSCDFGDERKMFKRSHIGGVTDVKFVPKTHLFFSCGFDGKIKQWDGDNFQLIQTLDKHHGVIRCLTISNDGGLVVSCGQDHFIHKWMRTEEPIVLEEQWELEKEKTLEESDIFQRRLVSNDAEAEAVGSSINPPELEKCVDNLFEALQIYENLLVSPTEASKHPLLTLVYQTADPNFFMLQVLRKIKSYVLYEAIFALPFNAVLTLLTACKSMLEKDWDVPLATSVAVYSARVFMEQLSNSTQGAEMIRQISPLLLEKINKLENTVGLNTAGLYYHKNLIEEKGEQQLFYEAAQKLSTKRKARKKKQRAVLLL